MARKKKEEQEVKEVPWTENPVIHFTIAAITTTILIMLLLVATIQGFTVTVPPQLPYSETLTVSIKGLVCDFDGLCEADEIAALCQPDCDPKAPRVGGRAFEPEIPEFIKPIGPVIEDWGPCCYPLNCPQAKDNPPDCKCEYMVWCGVLNITDLPGYEPSPHIIKTGWINNEYQRGGGILGNECPNCI